MQVQKIENADEHPLSDWDEDDRPTAYKIKKENKTVIMTVDEPDYYNRFEICFYHPDESPRELLTAAADDWEFRDELQEFGFEFQGVKVNGRGRTHLGLRAYDDFEVRLGDLSLVSGGDE